MLNKYALYSEPMYLVILETCKVESLKMLNKIFHFLSYLIDEILMLFNLDLIVVTFHNVGTNLWPQYLFQVEKVRVMVNITVITF